MFNFTRPKEKKKFSELFPIKHLVSKPNLRDGVRNANDRLSRILQLCYVYHDKRNPITLEIIKNNLREQNEEMIKDVMKLWNKYKEPLE